MKTEKQILEKIDRLKRYVSRLEYLVYEAISSRESSSFYVREIELSYKEIHALLWVIEE